MILVAIYDKKAKTYGAVYTERNPEVAIRNFSQACQDTNTNLNKFSEDFNLVMLANYNEETGKITPLKDKNQLSRAREHVVNFEKRKPEVINE